MCEVGVRNGCKRLQLGLGLGLELGLELELVPETEWRQKTPVFLPYGQG